MCSRVRVEPLGAEFSVGPGESVMSGAQRAGLDWPTTCHGDGVCSHCWVEVLAGAANLGDLDQHEASTLRLLSPLLAQQGGALRLACQLLVRGDVVVHKKGVRRSGDQPTSH